jgi:predicted ABC-type ATPase
METSSEIGFSRAIEGGFVKSLISSGKPIDHASILNHFPNVDLIELRTSEGFMVLLKYI